MKFSSVTVSLCAMLLVAVIINTAHASYIPTVAVDPKPETVDAMPSRALCKNLWCGNRDSPNAKGRFVGYQGCASSQRLVEGKCSLSRNAADCRKVIAAGGTCATHKMPCTPPACIGEPRISCVITNAVTCTPEVCYCQ